ncbi:tyrosine-type recombinase/integrase [Rhodococcus sp. NPDC058514]|uniref:tyrosine-type recombinase/integrase n=1 Tax=unclassified Rhodococcus (in: high G+C Gram-positive bacteria) TaxID=192944 RepID=UPI00365DD5B8
MLVQHSAALEDAVEQGLLTRNVARLVERPKVTAAEMQTWTREQVAAFRRHVRGDRLYACWLLSLCGLRRSEVLGMAWESIDLDAGTVAVVQGRVAVNSSETAIGDPKSARSRRVLPIPPDVAAALRAFKVAQASERLALGSGYPDTGLVAVHEDGLPIRHEWYGDEFKRQAKAAGVPVIRLHDARHTAASIMLDAGNSV